MEDLQQAIDAIYRAGPDMDFVICAECGAEFYQGALPQGETFEQHVGRHRRWRLICPKHGARDIDPPEPFGIIPSCCGKATVSCAVPCL